MSTQDTAFKVALHGVVNPSRIATQTGVQRAGEEYTLNHVDTGRYLYLGKSTSPNKYYPGGYTLSRIDRETGAIHVFNMLDALQGINGGSSTVYRKNGAFIKDHEYIMWWLTEENIFEDNKVKYRSKVYTVRFKLNNTFEKKTYTLPNPFSDMKWFGNKIEAYPIVNPAGYLDFILRYYTENSNYTTGSWRIFWQIHKASLSEMSTAVNIVEVENDSAEYLFPPDLGPQVHLRYSNALADKHAGNNSTVLGHYLIELGGPGYAIGQYDIGYSDPYPLFDGQIRIVDARTNSQRASRPFTKTDTNLLITASGAGAVYDGEQDTQQRYGLGFYAIMEKPVDGSTEHLIMATMSYNSDVRLHVGRIPVELGQSGVYRTTPKLVDDKFNVYSVLQIASSYGAEKFKMQSNSAISGNKNWEAEIQGLQANEIKSMQFYEEQSAILLVGTKCSIYLDAKTGNVIWNSLDVIDPFESLVSASGAAGLHQVALLPIKDVNGEYSPTLLTEAMYPSDNTVVKPFEWVDLDYTPSGPILDKLDVALSVHGGTSGTQDINEYDWPLDFGPWPGGTSIQVPSVRLRLHTKGQYSVSAQYSDGSSFDISADAIVGLSNPEVVTMQGNELTGIKTGMTLLQASFDGVNAYGLVEVYGPERLEVEPEQLSIRIARRTPLKAFAIYADGFQEDCTLNASWVSDSSQYVNVVAPGLVEGVQKGYGSLTVSYGDVFASVSVDIIDIDAPYIMNVDAESATLYVYFKLTETLPEPTYFRTDVYSDEAQSSPLASTNLVENPESFKMTVDNGISWHPVNADGIIPSPDNVEVFMSEIYIGPKTRVWTTVSAALISATDEIPEDTDPPIMGISPATASYKESILVEVTTNKRANIYYTLDGSMPSTSSSLYKGPITLDSSKTFKAIAVDLDGRMSAVQERLYVIDRLAPILSLNLDAGNYLEGTKLLIAASEEAVIKYTNMDIDPAEFGEIYEGPIELTSSGTYRFVAIDKAGNVSAEVVRSFVVIPEGGTEEYQVETPVETEVTYRLTPEYPVKHVLLTGLTIGTEYIVELSEGSDLYVEDVQVRLMAVAGTYTFIAQQETHAIRIKSRVPITQDTSFTAIAKNNMIKGDDILQITSLSAGAEYRIRALDTVGGTMQVTDSEGALLAEGIGEPLVVTFVATGSTAILNSTAEIDMSSANKHVRYMLSKVVDAVEGNPVTLADLVQDAEYFIHGNGVTTGSIKVYNWDNLEIASSIGTPPKVGFKATEDVSYFMLEGTADMADGDVLAQVEIGRILGDSFETAIEVDVNGAPEVASINLDTLRRFFRADNLIVGEPYRVETLEATISTSDDWNQSHRMYIYNDAKELLATLQPGTDTHVTKSHVGSLFVPSTTTMYFEIENTTISVDDDPEDQYRPFRLKLMEYPNIAGQDFASAIPTVFVDPVEIDGFTPAGRLHYMHHEFTGLTVGEEYSFRVEDRVAGRRMYLYDGAQTEVTYKNGTAGYCVIRWVATTTTAFIAIRSYSDDINSGTDIPYHLEAATFDATPGSLPTATAPVSLGVVSGDLFIDKITQQLYVSFEVVDWGDYKVTVTGAEVDKSFVQVALRKGDDTHQISSPVSGEPGSRTSTINLPGTFLVQVKPVSSARTFNYDAPVQVLVAKV